MESEKMHVVICPGAVGFVELKEGRFHLIEEIHGDPKEKCTNSTNLLTESFQIQAGTTKYIFCAFCFGYGHEECSKSSLIKHPLHPKHTLMFVICGYLQCRTRKCYCCEDPLKQLFYCCLSCNVGINLACIDKDPLLSINFSKRHEHTLTLFPRQVTTHCNVCALDDSTSPIYICHCDFVVHKRCIDLPWSIRISRHPHHRLSFTSSFALGDRFCNICRGKINNEYGGYICNKEGCSYFAHSRCALRANVWDGKELEGEPDEVEEEVKPPFERLGDGTIRHFSHEHHPLTLVEETSYDEWRLCQACVMPIYYGNFYSCALDCSFILHEACANMSRTIYHDIHPHPLVLRTEYLERFRCSACEEMSDGFFYECEKCEFKLHVQCATIYEPLIHNSHVHPLFLTSAPGEYKSCSICKQLDRHHNLLSPNETFNCIESECRFYLCYRCAVLPHKVRYKHDKHFLTLFYGEETENWCELCEKKIKPDERFYACEVCCVTLHMECVLGMDRNFRFGRDKNIRLGPFSSITEFDILPNNCMTRPICSFCNQRCNQKMVLQCGGKKICSFTCMTYAS